MNRDDVIRAVNDACPNATAEKIADAIMELEKKLRKPEWENDFFKAFNDVFPWENGLISPYRFQCNKLKHFIRTEIIEKICEEIKKATMKK